MKIINSTEFLRNMAELYEKAGWDPKEVHFSLMDLIENIGNEPKIVVEATNANWIPVEERLPEIDTNKPRIEYLITTYTPPTKRRKAFYSVFQACYTDNLHELDDYVFPDDSYKRPGWYCEDSEMGYYEIGSPDYKLAPQVIAWMPMPEPYQR